MLLLSQEPAPVSRRDTALTARFLLPAAKHLEEFFLGVRAETDRGMDHSTALKYGEKYPLGYCREITQDVLRRLGNHLPRPQSKGARALKAFLAAGGTGRCVWGILRGRYFQTALQFGGLYVDVANDTVAVTKPKVEIMPMETCGLEAVRGPEHFAATAESYWGIRVFANHALPSLAPLLPMIAVNTKGYPTLESATIYMTELCRRDGFAQSEAWLADGPVPPARVVEDLRARCPADLLAANPHADAESAVASCRSARAAGLASDKEWSAGCLKEYARIHTIDNAERAHSPAAQ